MPITTASNHNRNIETPFLRPTGSRRAVPPSAVPGFGDHVHRCLLGGSGGSVYADVVTDQVALGVLARAPGPGRPAGRRAGRRPRRRRGASSGSCAALGLLVGVGLGVLLGDALVQRLAGGLLVGRVAEALGRPTTSPAASSRGRARRPRRDRRDRPRWRAGPRRRRCSRRTTPCRPRCPVRSSVVLPFMRSGARGLRTEVAVPAVWSSMPVAGIRTLDFSSRLVLILGA